jgi:predicted deacylase
MPIDLLTTTIRGHHDGPHLLITGGVHGDEFEPMWAVRLLTASLSSMELRGQVTLVPCVNEPAFRRGERTAEDGLDLARTCPGRADGSVTEQVAHALSQLIQAADYYIDLHTGGTRLQVFPLVGYMLHPRSETLAVQRRMARAFGLPLIWGTDASLNGRSLSIARDAKVPAIYAEYLGGGTCSRQGVEAYYRGCRNVLAELQMIDEPIQRPVQEPLVVEDPRPNSGYMQINHPAPREGFFEPAVSLGQRVHQGEPFGVVTDVSGKERRAVAAAHTGCVIVLRSFARVLEADSLGVVLETNGMLPTMSDWR